MVSVEGRWDIGIEDKEIVNIFTDEDDIGEMWDYIIKMII